MRTSLLLATSVFLFATPVVIVACGSSGSSDPAPGDGTSSGGTNPPGTTPPGVDPNAPPPPAAVGDPCRGAALPDDQHYGPTGTCTNVVASNLGSLRQITFAPNGDLFGVTTNGAIKLLHDANGDGVFQAGEITTYANTGGNGNNCDLDVAGGFLYAGTSTGVKRWPYTATSTTGGAGEDVMTGQPDGGHTYHTTHVYDGYLYVHSGSAGNAVLESGTATGEYDSKRSLIRRFKLDTFTSGTPLAWLSGEIVTQGLRNASGFKRNELTKKIYTVVNGLDDIGYQGTNVHWDNPGEQVAEVAAGKAYGYPYCFTAQRVKTPTGVVTPGTQLINAQLTGGHDDAWCQAHSSQPTTFIQAHSAPLDIVFFDTQPTGNLPEAYRGGAFVALHGSWDRTTDGGCPAGEDAHCAPTGYKVVWIPFNADGTAPMPTSTATDTVFPYQTVFGGGSTGTPGVSKDGPWSWSSGSDNGSPRPVGVAIGPIDGALYVSTDSDGGMIYRVGIKH